MKDTCLDLLYGKKVDASSFQFDSLTAPPLHSLLPENIMMECYKVAHSLRLASKIKEKKQMIENLVKPYGLQRAFCGTNRLVFRHIEYPDIMIKIGFDRSGIKDSLKEYKNQQYIKPFCEKVFEVHHTGAIAIFEKVISIRTLQEFMPFAQRIFRLLNNCILGKYVLDDIGCKEFYQNYGIRKGFGPVILDFPYMYKLDGKKLICNNKVNGIACCGIIDYDNTFDNLICTKCGKRFFAKDLDDGSDLDEDDGIVRFVKPRKEKENKFICRGEDDNMIRNEVYVQPTQEEIDLGYALADNEIMIYDDDVEETPVKQQPVEEKVAEEPINDEYYEDDNETKKIINELVDNKPTKIRIDLQDSNETNDSLSSIKEEVSKEVIDKREEFDVKYSNLRRGFMVESTFIPDKKEDKEINADDLEPIDTSSILINKKEEIKVQRTGEIPENLGEIIQNNQLDEDDDYNELLKKFNLDESDFNDEPIQTTIEQPEEENDEPTKEKMYHNGLNNDLYF